MAEVKQRETKNTQQNRKRKPRRRFLAVDVWRNKFGPVSVRAVYDVFQTAKKIETHNLKNYSFSDAINYLRSLEDEDYVPPQDKISNN